MKMSVNAANKIVNAISFGVFVLMHLPNAIVYQEKLSPGFCRYTNFYFVTNNTFVPPVTELYHHLIRITGQILRVMALSSIVAILLQFLHPLE